LNLKHSEIQFTKCIEIAEINKKAGNLLIDFFTKVDNIDVESKNSFVRLSFLTQSRTKTWYVVDMLGIIKIIEE
jgi:hypothetical protein